MVRYTRRFMRKEEGVVLERSQRGKEESNTHNITASFQNSMRCRQARETPTDDNDFCAGHTRPERLQFGFKELLNADLMRFR